MTSKRLVCLYSATFVFSCVVIFLSFWALIGVVNSQEKKTVSLLTIQSKHYDLTNLPINLFDLSPQNDTLTVCRNITAISVLDLLREYSVECYADSTLIISGGGPKINVPIAIDSLGRKTQDFTQSYSQLAVYIISREWVHREPTLPGFMAFLEEKYK